jgi:hypothetical protein
MPATEANSRIIKLSFENFSEILLAACFILFLADGTLINCETPNYQKLVRTEMSKGKVLVRDEPAQNKSYSSRYREISAKSEPNFLMSMLRLSEKTKIHVYRKTYRYSGYDSDLMLVAASHPRLDYLIVELDYRINKKNYLLAYTWNLNSSTLDPFDHLTDRNESNLFEPFVHKAVMLLLSRDYSEEQKNDQLENIFLINPDPYGDLFR